MHLPALTTSWWTSQSSHRNNLRRQGRAGILTAPVPETRTPEKPNARNFLSMRLLSANRSTELRESVALYRFPC
jgi:hypothetical protein